MTCILGPYLLALRHSRKFTLRGIEAACGVSNAYISQLETGKITTPSPAILRKLADAYGVSYQVLMEKTGYVDTESTPYRGETILPGSRLLIAAFKDLTPEEEDEILLYLNFLRFRRKRG